LDGVDIGQPTFGKFISSYEYSGIIAAVRKKEVFNIDMCGTVK